MSQRAAVPLGLLISVITNIVNAHYLTIRKTHYDGIRLSTDVHLLIPRTCKHVAHPRAQSGGD